MSIVAYKYCMTVDSRVEDAIVAHLENNQEIKFTCCVHGFYYFGTATVSPADTPHGKITDNETIDKSENSVTSYSFFSTVVSNKEYFT